MSQTSQITEIVSVHSGYLEKWFRTTESRKNFVKAGDKIASISTLEKNSFDVLSNVSGTLISCNFEVGSFVEAGSQIACIQSCVHPAIMDSMCVSCGDRVVISNTSNSKDPSTVSVFSSGKYFQMQQSEAVSTQKSRVSNLRSAKKLALVLDLDHTLIHACERKTPATEKEKQIGIHTLSLEDSSNVGLKNVILVKFRPHLLEFLIAANKLYQLSIYTAGML